MKLNVNELEVILEGLIMLDNVNSGAFYNYKIDYNELYEKIEKEIKDKS